MGRIVLAILALVYAGALVFFAFRPFERIPAACGRHAAVKCEEGAIRIVPGQASEVEHRRVLGMRNALRRSNEISLDIMLKTDSLREPGPARILTYSRDAQCRNFMLAQQGNALEFRLRTTETDHNGLLSTLLVPQVLDPGRFQHLVVTYDGERVRLYVDGKLCSEHVDLHGGFSDWGRNHILVLGDEPDGGNAWSGRIRRFAIYDRALKKSDVADLMKGEAVPGAILGADFHENPDAAAMKRKGIIPLKYRNVVITTDSSPGTLVDNIANIIGFLPLGALCCLALPRLRGIHKVMAMVFAPLLLGFVVSGGIEWSQRFLAGRVPSALDVVNNVMGTLLGCLGAWLVFSDVKNKKYKQEIE